MLLYVSSDIGIPMAMNYTTLFSKDKSQLSAKALKGGCVL